MINERDAQPAAVNAEGRRRAGWVIDPLPPRPALRGQLPFEERAFRLPAGLMIVEAPAVEMVAGRPVVSRRGELPLQGDGDRCDGRNAGDGDAFLHLKRIA